MRFFLGFIFTFLLSPLLVQAQTAIQEAKLSNGIHVLLMEAHNVPMVAMQLLLPSGSRFDPKGKGGTAALMASMLTDHTKIHDHKAWAAWLDSEAVSLGAGVSRDALIYSTTVLSEALPLGLDMLAESLLQPAWDAKRFVILQQDAIAGATKAMETSGYRASIYTSAILYGEHAYGHRPGGTLESLAKITLNDLKKLYAKQFKPAGVTLAVSGDIT
ncbi:MAG: insulinase family protein, partial [Mariprofundaceae bacterium]|nr:insulinase family protein [Mariprofundaceae bacterium]